MNQKGEKKKKQEIYSLAHQNLLAQLINIYDPERITWAANRSANHASNKKKIWDQIVPRFNQASGRREPSDATQLIRQGQFMKTKVR